MFFLLLVRVCVTAVTAGDVVCKMCSNVVQGSAQESEANIFTEHSYVEISLSTSQ